MPSLDDDVGSNSDFKLHVFIEVDISGTRSTVKHLQRYFRAVLHVASQLDHGLDTFNNLSLDHSGQRKPGIEPSRLRGKPFSTEALLHKVDKLMPHVFEDKELNVRNISWIPSWQWQHRIFIKCRWSRALEAIVANLRRSRMTVIAIIAAAIFISATETSRRW